MWSLRCGAGANDGRADRWYRKPLCRRRSLPSADSWRLIPFICYFVLGALSSSGSIGVNRRTGNPWTYGIWLFLGVTGPLVNLFWWMIATRKDPVRGFWARLSLDVMVHRRAVTSAAITNRPLTGPGSSPRYLIRAILMFTRLGVGIWLRSSWWRVARRIHRGDRIR